MTESSLLKTNGSKIWIFLLVFLVIDLAQSTYHYSNLPLDGDLVTLVAPNRWYEDALNDPFGLAAIGEQKEYPGAGRFFCHVVSKAWFDQGTKLAGILVDSPILKLYLTSLLCIFLLHAMFILLAIAYNRRKGFDLNQVLMTALLASVLIQYNSFYDSIGIIDRSVTYVFFYSLPLFFLLIYFLPFYHYYRSDGNKDMHRAWHVPLILLAPVLGFSGPLIQPVVFICFALFVVGNLHWVQFFKLKRNKALILHFSFLFLICAYAFYVSTYNSEKNFTVSLVDRYFLMGKGLFKILTLENVWYYIFIAIGINSMVIFRMGVESKHRLKQIMLFVSVFAVMYILLLPWGGYRPYRPLIIRYDTFLPVTLLAMFVLLHSTLSSYQLLKGKQRYIYLAGYTLFCFLLFYADRDVEKEANYCQQGLFQEILESNDKVVRMDYRCDFLMWDESFINDIYHMEAVHKCLYRWDILDEDQQLEFYVDVDGQ